MTNEIVISDLSICEPADRLHRDFRHGTWRLVGYETELFGGTMVYSGPGMDSAPLKLPINTSGYHKIYVGVQYPEFCDVHVRLRLTDDPAYTLVRSEQQSEKDRQGLPNAYGVFFTGKAFREWEVTEAFWKIADLAGQDLTISRFNEGSPGQGGNEAELYSNLVFIRLVPLTDDEIADYHRELPRDDTRRLLAMNDGGIFINVRTKEDIWAQIEPYRESDVDVMLWATFKGENSTYRTKVGRQPPAAYSPFDRFASGDWWHDSLTALESEGTDFMTEAIHAAHAAGLRIFPSLRLQTADKPVPRDLSPGSFQEQHPEFLSRDRAGCATGRMSLAYPEVRQFWVDLLCEAVAYGFDGAHVIFCRSWPFVYYDEPAIERFQALYGENLLDITDDDPRFRALMAEYVMQFAREVKAAMDTLGHNMSKSLELAYSVNNTIESNLKWGIDVQALVNERLVDYLIPHPTNAMNASEWLPWYIDLVRGTPVRLYPDLYPRRQPAAAALYSADTLYDLGCDGIALWDTYARTSRISEWATMKRLGHREEIKLWRESGKGNDHFRVIPFTRLADRGVDPRFYFSDG